MGQESDVETDDDKKYNIGDVVNIAEYLPEFGANQPTYQIKGITEEGKYIIERLTDDGAEVTPPREIEEDISLLFQNPHRCHSMDLKQKIHHHLLL